MLSVATMLFFIFLTSDWAQLEVQWVLLLRAIVLEWPDSLIEVASPRAHFLETSQHIEDLAIAPAFRFDYNNLCQKNVSGCILTLK